MEIQNSFGFLWAPENHRGFRIFFVTVGIESKCSLSNPLPLLGRSKSYFWNSDFLIKWNQECQQFSLLKNMLTHVRNVLFAYGLVSSGTS